MQTITVSKPDLLKILQENRDKHRDHTPDYDRIIRMVTMHIGDTFDLTESDFQAYVMDDWSWKRAFLDTSNSYAAATVTQVYGEENS
jgi:hypothetical protein